MKSQLTTEDLCPYGHGVAYGDAYGHASCHRIGLTSEFLTSERMCEVKSARRPTEAKEQRAFRFCLDKLPQNKGCISLRGGRLPLQLDQVRRIARCGNCYTISLGRVFLMTYVLRVFGLCVLVGTLSGCGDSDGVVATDDAIKAHIEEHGDQSLAPGASTDLQD